MENTVIIKVTRYQTFTISCLRLATGAVLTQMIFFYLYRCQRVHQVSKQLLVQWKPHILLPEGNWVSFLDGAVWDSLGHMCGAGCCLDSLCDGSLCQISQHPHSEGHKPRTILRPPLLTYLLLLQLAHLHRTATGLDVPFTPARLWDQFCSLHLLHPGENQQSALGIWSQDPNKSPS